ncbi:hypothetical protein EGR52_03340 [bacterium]|nr:hypothetical protein [bacterium]
MKDSFYEYFLKDSLLAFLVKQKAIIKDINDLNVTFKYEIDARIIRKIFASLKYFEVLKIERIEKNTSYLVYLAAFYKRYKTNFKVIINQGNLFFPKGTNVEYFSFMLKRTLNLVVYKNEELVSDLFYKILEVNVNDIKLLVAFYNLINNNKIDTYDTLIDIFNIYQGNKKKIDYTSLKNRINRKNCKKVLKEWESIKKNNIFINYDLNKVLEKLEDLVTLLSKWEGND